MKKLKMGQTTIFNLIAVTLMGASISALPVDQPVKPHNPAACFPAKVCMPEPTITTTPSPRPQKASPSTAPVAPAQEAQPAATAPGDMAATLACIRSYEGGYTSVNPAGYYGAYQFNQGTWNSTASAAGRSDLVGVNPATVAPADQDAMAINLISRRGLQPWPTPNRMCR